MKLCLNADGNIVEAVIREGVTDPEYDAFLPVLANCPAPVDGKRAVLQYPSLVWETVADDTPDAETDAQALTRYINEQTGANDRDIVAAAETLIKNIITEE